MAAALLCAKRIGDLIFHLMCVDNLISVHKQPITARPDPILHPNDAGVSYEKKAGQITRRRCAQLFVYSIINLNFVK